MSASAGIPLAHGMVAEIKEQFKHLCSSCERETYPAYMSLLAPAQRRQVIGAFVDNAKINLAHLYLGALVKENYVDRILTTNFDPLVVRSLALFNLYPAVYDFAASQAFIPGEAAQLSVFYLHGQRDGFVLLNTENEINRHSEKIKNVFQDVSTGRCWIVIGYSGENDPVFTRLSEVGVFQNKLFWIGYKDSEPKEHVMEYILKPKEKFGYFVKGHDADSFFLALAKELGLSEPQVISKPFSHLKEAIETIADYSIDEKIADPTKETKKWIEMAIEGFEEGKGFENIKEAQKDIIDKDELIRKTRDIWVHERFDQIDGIIENVLSSDEPEAKKYLAYALNSWGNALSDLAITKKDEDAENLLKQSIEKYEQALIIKPDIHEALYNWGTALVKLAKTKEGGEAEDLFKQSFNKFDQALKIKPDKHEAFYNWGIALSFLAKTKEGKVAEDLFKQSLDKYDQALKIKPDYHEALCNWGIALSDLAKTKEGEEVEDLFKQSFDKYEQALIIKPDYHEALNNWGIALLVFAKTKDGGEVEDLFKQSIEKLMDAEKLKEGTASYNIACINALSGNTKESLEWLEKGLKLKPTPSREHILADGDLDIIKVTDEFKRILDQYRPE